MTHLYNEVFEMFSLFAGENSFRWNALHYKTPRQEKGVT